MPAVGVRVGVRKRRPVRVLIDHGAVAVRRPLESDLGHGVGHGDSVVRHRVANGGESAGAGGPVRLGIERFYSLTADVSLGANFAKTEAILIEAGVTVFQNLFMISGFLSLLAIVPALLMRTEYVKEPDVIA